MRTSYDFYAVHIDVIPKPDGIEYHLTAKRHGACYIERSAEEAMSRANQINLVMLAQRKMTHQRGRRPEHGVGQEEPVEGILGTH